MSWIAKGGTKECDFIQGDTSRNISIMEQRYFYLWTLWNYDNSLKVAMHDLESDKWTSWLPFPGKLFQCQTTKNTWKGDNNSHLNPVVDAHRSLLNNEIVIESDYPTYEENYDASKIVGAILEDKGFKPLYYFSGNKSIHIHIFFDYRCLTKVDPLLQDIIIKKFGDSWRFKKKFMKWLRELMIKGWNTGVREFDTDLIRATHLIRSELSRNKLGYKTFLGYSYKDLSFIPYICNENNTIYPKLGELRLSSPHKIDQIIQEFLDATDTKNRIDKVRRKNFSLNVWLNKDNKGGLRPCVEYLLGEDFTKIGDGYNRAMFILANELKKEYGEEKAGEILEGWNNRNGFPVEKKEIWYRVKAKNYSLPCSYIHSFLEEFGVDISKKCQTQGI